MKKKHLIRISALALAAGAAAVVMAASTFAAGGPALSVSAPVAVPHAPAAVSGSGFMAGEVVHLTFGAAAQDVTADQGGNISAQMTIPAVPTGSYFIGAFGETSGKWALGYLWVAGFSPTLTPSSWYITPGQAVTLAGQGFAPNEAVAISYKGSTIASTTTSASGSFSGVALALPLSLSNTVATVSAVGAVSNAAVSAGITVGQLYPSIAPSTWYTSPGTIISVTGSGFAPGEAVAVNAGASHASTTADAQGNFLLNNFALPTTGGVTVPLTALGARSGASASVGIFLTGFNPWITLSTYWAQGGSPLTISGQGFAPNEAVGFTSGGKTLASTTAGADGSLTLNTQVPFAPAGAVTLTLLGATSNTPASTQMTAAPVYTSLQLKNYAGAPGQAVEFIGSGYLPNEPVELTTDRTGAAIEASWSADASGSFDNSSFTPASSTACGPMNLTVEGEHSFDSKTIGYYVTGC